MADDILQTRRNIRELTKVGEREIHEAVEDRAARVGQVRRMRVAKTVHALRFSLE